MTDPRDTQGHDLPQPRNREERRRLRYGSAGGGAPAPEDSGVEGPHEAQTGGPDQDVTHLAGPGTGGATESAGRIPHHSGAHVSTTPKG